MSLSLLLTLYQFYFTHCGGVSIVNFEQVNVGRVSITGRMKKSQYQLRQSIQEWTKQNLWKTAFKKYEPICSSKQAILVEIF